MFTDEQSSETHLRSCVKSHEINHNRLLPQLCLKQESKELKEAANVLNLLILSINCHYKLKQSH